MPRKPKDSAARHDLAVKCRFGNLSIGAEKATIGVTVERQAIDYETLAPLVVGGRLDVLLKYDRNGQKDLEGQQKLADTAVELTNVADCPSLAIRPSKLSFRLSFAMGSVNLDQLTGAAQMAGELGITRIGDSGAVDEGEGDAGDGE